MTSWNNRMHHIAREDSHGWAALKKQRGTRQGSVSHACSLRRALLKSNHVTHNVHIYVRYVCILYIYISFGEIVESHVESRSGSGRLASVPLASRKNPPLKFASRESGLLPSRRSRCALRDIADRTRRNVDALSFLNYNRLQPNRIAGIIEAFGFCAFALRLNWSVTSIWIFVYRWSDRLRSKPRKKNQNENTTLKTFFINSWQ